MSAIYTKVMMQVCGLKDYNMQVNRQHKRRSITIRAQLVTLK